MRAARALIGLLGIVAVASPTQAAFDLAEAKQIIVRYRNQWIADSDKIREARIGTIYDIPLAGTGVCIAIDRLGAGGASSGLKPLLLVLKKIDVTPAPVTFQKPPEQKFEFHVTAAPESERCSEGAMLPFPELRNVGGQLKR
jgi:hypothetical protein